MPPPPSDSQLHAQFNRASISEKDFQECEECLHAYQRDGDYSEVAQKALLVAAVVAYARPFRASDTGDRSTPRLPGGALKALTADEKRLHVHILDVRDKAVAHSAFLRKAVRRVRGLESGFLTTGRIFDIRAEVQDVASLKVMAHNLRHYCHNSMYTLSARLRVRETAEK